jgi:hypothetical protein
VEFEIIKLEDAADISLLVPFLLVEGDLVVQPGAQLEHTGEIYCVIDLTDNLVVDDVMILAMKTSFDEYSAASCRHATTPTAAAGTAVGCAATSPSMESPNAAESRVYRDFVKEFVDQHKVVNDDIGGLR